MAGTFRGLITDEGISLARRAIETPGWTIAPYKWQISDVYGDFVQSRNSSSKNDIWTEGQFSLIQKMENNKILLRLYLSGDTVSVRKEIMEIYIICKGEDNQDYLYGLIQPETDLIFEPGTTQEFDFIFTLSNTANADIYTIEYMNPQAIEDHNLASDSHPDIRELIKTPITKNGHELYDLVMKDHILSFEESKGYALLGSYVYKNGIAGSRYGYPEFYNKCLEEKTIGVETQVTLGGTDITMYINDNGHQFYNIADKETVDNFYNTMGMAWFYGVDEDNERIFLPRAKYSQLITGELSVVGNGSLRLSTGLNSYNIAVSSIGDIKGVTCMFPNDSTDLTPINTAVSGSRQYSTNTLGVSANPENSGIKVHQTENTFIYMVVGNSSTELAMTEVTEITTSENDTLPLFTGQFFDFIPEHISWIKANTTVSGDVYTTAYNELVNALTNNPKQYKVINVGDMEPNTDYSLYWKINQTAMTLTAPSRIDLLSESPQLNLYFKVANAVQNLELLDAAEVLDAVNDKLGIADVASYIVENYINGTSWYRVWSDGWIEQGGKTANINISTSLTISLLKEFSNTSYNISATSGRDNNLWSQPGVHTLTVSSFKLMHITNTGSDCPFYWRACGY